MKLSVVLVIGLVSLLLAGPAAAETLAFAIVYDIAEASETDKVDVLVKFIVLGSDQGTYSVRENSVAILGVPTGTLDLYRASIRNAVQADMEDHEIVFGLFDTVLLD